MSDILKSYPPAWLLVGILISGAIFIVANRKVFAMQRDATNNLIITFKEQIAALTAERNNYRENLHLEKQDHTAARLKLTEIEGRPDLTSIQDVMNNVVISLTSVAAKLQSRDPVFDRIEKGFEQTTKILGKVVDHFDAIEKRTRKKT